MKLDWATIPRPIIALSPMADMTDSAFCRIVRLISQSDPERAGRVDVKSRGDHVALREGSNDLIVFREMVSSEAIIRGNDKTLGMTEIHKDERPIVQQIFGSEPEKMAEAAKIIERDHAPEGFDINMGCPVYKVTHSFNGASLMKDPERAAEIVRAVKEAVNVPVSVKIRAGWENPKDCLTFGTVLEGAGADLITIHGRTKKQGYAEQSDWDLIGEFTKTVSIPVLANGDIYTPQLMTEALETSGAAGALIARGALGNPWIFRQIHDHLAGREPKSISLQERIEVLKQHLRWHMEQFDSGSVQTFRKHISWYFRAIPGAKPFKARLHTVDTLEELDTVLDEVLADGLSDEALSRRDASHPLAADRLFISK